MASNSRNEARSPKPDGNLCQQDQTPVGSHLFVTVEGKNFPEGTTGRFQSFMEKAKLRAGKTIGTCQCKEIHDYQRPREKGDRRRLPLFRGSWPIPQRLLREHMCTPTSLSWVPKLYTWASNSWKWKKINRSEESRGKNEDITATTSTRETSASVDTVAALKPTDGSEDSEGPKTASTSTLGRTASVKTAAAPKPNTSTEQEQDPDCEEAVQPSNATDTALTSTYSVSII